MRKRWFLVGMIFLLMVLLSACAAPAPTPAPTPTPVPAPVPVPAPSPTPIKKITLADAPQVLDLLPLLPTSFEKVDAASEGMSNADLGLGPDFSEVELFISDEPFQMIYCCLAIMESRVEQASFDAIMKNEEMVKSLIIENIKAGALEEDYEVEEAEVQITYPAIADLAVLGEGYFGAFGISAGFDICFFRSNKVLVSIFSGYFSPDRQTLLPIVREIEHRIGMFSQ